MFNLLKKLWRDRRGNALVIAGLALPLVVGSAGLASDTVEWTLWKRELQRTADGAALAAVYAEAQGTSIGTGTCSTYSSAAYTSPVAYDVKKNNKLWPTLTCSYQNKPTSGSYTADKWAVKVNLSVQQQLSFSGLFLSTAPTITASATATLVDSGSFCMDALNSTTSPGITIGGSSTVNLGCGAMANSTSTTAAVQPNGNSYSFAATPVAAAGALPSSITGATNLQPWHIPVPDPFAGTYSTSVPAGMSCTNFNSHITKTQGGNGKGNTKTYTMSPGCYNDFSPSGGDSYSLSPGVYFLNSTDFNPGGGVTVSGTGVTIILTGTTPGSVSLDGNETITLGAPTSSTCAVDSAGTNSCNYNKMLFIQSSSASTNNLNKFNGTSSSSFDGAFYFPTGQVQLNGTSGTMTQCAMVVAYTIDISGNATLQNDTSSCKANQTVSGKVVRLVE
jgi:Flp pilus assembly protein TadG